MCSIQVVGGVHVHVRTSVARIGISGMDQCTVLEFGVLLARFLVFYTGHV